MTSHRETLSFMADAVDWNIIGANLTSCLAELRNVQPPLLALAKASDFNIDEWIEVLRMMLSVESLVLKFQWSSLNALPAPKSTNAKKYLKRALLNSEEVKLLAPELNKLTAAFSPDTFQDISGNMRRRRPFQQVINALYKKLTFVLWKWQQDAASLPSVSAEDLSFLSKIEGEPSNYFSEPGAREFWSKRFSGRFMVTWKEFTTASEAIRGAPLSEELSTTLEGLLDPCGSALVSAMQLAKAVNGFGPFSSFFVNVEAVFAQPWFKGYVSLHDAARMLDAEPPGTYLVRLREGHPGQFAVAFVHPEASAVVHVAVENTRTSGFNIKQGDKVLSFDRIEDIIHAYARFLRAPLEGNLACEPWFYGDASGREATDMLSGQTKASFLMRFSQGNPNCLATAYVANDGQIVHSLILKSKDGFQHGQDPAFPSLADLISAYQAVLSFPHVSSVTLVDDAEAAARATLSVPSAASPASPSPRSGTPLSSPLANSGSDSKSSLVRSKGQRSHTDVAQGGLLRTGSLREVGTEAGLPTVAEQAILYLCDHRNAMTVDIFKKSKSANKVAQLKRGLEAGGEDVEIWEYEPHVVAQLLRTYLREMPQPLVPETMFERFVALNQSTPIASAKKLVAELAPENRLLLMYLVKLLTIVVEHKDANRMDAHALAQVIGPNIMRRRDMSMEDTLKNASNVYLATKYLIENAQALFPGLDVLVVDGVEVDDGLFLTPNRQQVKAGTPERLVEALFTQLRGGRIDAQNYSTFFRLTYQSFLTHAELLDMLSAKYIALESTLDAGDGDRENRVKRAKIGAFIAKWAQQYRGELLRSKSLFDRLKALPEAARDPTLRKHLQTSIEKLTRESEAEFVFAEKAPKPVKAKGKIAACTDMASLELARQLTLLQSELYSRVQPHELLESRWTKGDEKARRANAGNVIEVIHQYNRMVMWVATEILQSKKRERTVAFMVQLASDFLDLNNFNGIFAVCSALETAAVARLDDVKNLNKKDAARLDELKHILDPTGSYRAYREALKQANPPVTPYLGVYLTDLLMIHDGNVLELPGGLINFKKCIQTGVVIQSVQQFQQQPYNLKSLENIQKYLQSLVVISEDAAWELSQKIQPSRN